MKINSFFVMIQVAINKSISLNKFKHKPTVTFTIIYKLIQQYLSGTYSRRLRDSHYVHYEPETTNHLHIHLKPQRKYVPSKHYHYKNVDYIP